jgi:hypothetical protein
MINTFHGTGYKGITLALKLEKENGVLRIQSRPNLSIGWQHNHPARKLLFRFKGFVGKNNLQWWAGPFYITCYW